MDCPNCGSAMRLRKSLPKSDNDASGSPVTDDGADKVCPDCGHEIDTVSKSDDGILEKGLR